MGEKGYFNNKTKNFTIFQEGLSKYMNHFVMYYVVVFCIVISGDLVLCRFSVPHRIKGHPPSPWEGETWPLAVHSSLVNYLIVQLSKLQMNTVHTSTS